MVFFFVKIGNECQLTQFWWYFFENKQVGYDFDIQGCYVGNTVTFYLANISKEETRFSPLTEGKIDFISWFTGTI